MPSTRSFLPFLISWNVGLQKLFLLMEFLHSYKRTKTKKHKKQSAKRTGKCHVKRTPCIILLASLFSLRNPKCVALCFGVFFLFFFCVSESCRCRPPRYVAGEMSRQAANMMKTYLRLNFMWHLKCVAVFKCMLRFFSYAYSLVGLVKIGFSNVISHGTPIVAKRPNIFSSLSLWNQGQKKTRSVTIQWPNIKEWISIYINLIHMYTLCDCAVLITFVTNEYGKCVCNAWNREKRPWI